MNANELADFLDMYFSCNQPASNALCDAATMLRKLDGQLAFRIDAVTKYQAKVYEQQIEIEALKSKLNKYHLKEDLDRNLNLIYGKEFIK